MTQARPTPDVRPPLPAAAGDISARIDFLRLVLIVGIMFVHIPFTAQYEPYAGTGGSFEYLMIYLRDGLFRAGVPALSVISGFLLARQMSKPYGDLLRKKAGTLLVPFLIFNVGTFLAVYAMQLAGGGTFWHDVAGASVGEKINYAFGLTDYPINEPLYFLRDMVVCMILAPLLFIGARRAPWPTLAFLVFMVVLGRQVPVWGELQALVIFRPSIPLFLFAGLLLGLRKADLTRLDGHVAPAILVCAVGGLVMAWAMAPAAPLGQAGRYGVLLAAQVAICVSVWILSACLVRLPAGQFVARNGSKAFWLFCTHAPALVVLFMVWMKTGTSYPLFYLLSVPVTVVLLLALHAILGAVMPGVLAVALGARSGKGKARAAERVPRTA
ncbi:acyltransferase family protein [Aureimonas mangrovi]|uniref:acyltransferase family protein n=1 Tax=Aureimonas mangrovi TaxID=2758041 RepID=UPI00163D3E8A|nr:acyltransferase [Aureimonas mangrovi]